MAGKRRSVFVCMVVFTLALRRFVCAGVHPASAFRAYSANDVVAHDNPGLIQSALPATISRWTVDLS